MTQTSSHTTLFTGGWLRAGLISALSVESLVQTGVVERWSLPGGLTVVYKIRWVD